MEIWGRVQEGTDITSLSNLSKLIGITQPSVSERKRKNEFPLDWAYVIAQKYNLSMDWLITGKGPKRIGAEHEPKNSYVLLIDEWLDEMKQEDPRREEWFKCNFEDCFPSFKSWAQRKNAANQHRRLAETVA